MKLGGLEEKEQGERGEGDGAGGGEEEGESLAAPGETFAFICQMLL